METLQNSSIKNVIIYCRNSGKKEPPKFVQEWLKLDFVPIESQEQFCLDYCRNRNYNVIEIIKEYKSAKNIYYQKQLLEILDFSDINSIIVFDYSRFSRDSKNIEDILNKFEAKNIAIESLSNPICYDGSETIKQQIIKYVNDAAKRIEESKKIRNSPNKSNESKSPNKRIHRKSIKDFDIEWDLDVEEIPLKKQRKEESNTQEDNISKIQKQEKNNDVMNNVDKPVFQLSSNQEPNVVKEPMKEESNNSKKPDRNDIFKFIEKVRGKSSLEEANALLKQIYTDFENEPFAPLELDDGQNNITDGLSYQNIADILNDYHVKDIFFNKNEWSRHNVRRIARFNQIPKITIEKL